MGIFTRVADNIKAGVNKMIDATEDTEAMIDQAIRDKEAALNEAKSKSATVFGNVHRLVREINDLKVDSKEWESKIEKSIQAGRDDLATKAIAEKNKVESAIATLTSSLESAKTSSENLKNSLAKLEKDVEDLRNQRDTLVARLKTAEATEKVNEITAGIQSKGNTIDMDRLERKIVAKESRAEGLADLKTTTLEDEFAELETTSTVDQLAAYKAKYSK